MSEGRRAKLNNSLAEPKAKLRDILAEIQVLNPEKEGDEAPVLSPADSAKVATLNDQFNLLLDSEINPAWVKWGLESVTGLELDDYPAGQPINADALIEDGPPELFMEILKAIRNEAEVTPEKALPLSSGSTSGSSTGGTTTDTTAQPV
jgi:hypothetical protein